MKSVEQRLSIDTPIGCEQCGGTFTLRAVLEGELRYWRDVGAVIGKAPCCGGVEELRLSEETVWRGYSFAAGSAHFCPMEKYAAPGLECQGLGDTLRFRLDGRTHVLRLSE